MTSFQRCKPKNKINNYKNLGSCLDENDRLASSATGSNIKVQ